jgi:hypothetical protein
MNQNILITFSHRINPLCTPFDCHHWFLIHRAMFHPYKKAYYHCFRSHIIRKDDQTIRTFAFAIDSWVNFINVLFTSVHVDLAFCYRINSQVIFNPLVFNQSLPPMSNPLQTVMVLNASQFINRTTIMVIAPFLLNNSTMTTITAHQTTTQNNISTKSNPYKTLIICLLLFYTIIFEKYSRR